jgi:hypothetical protein
MVHSINAGCSFPFNRVASATLEPLETCTFRTHSPSKLLETLAVHVALYGGIAVRPYWYSLLTKRLEFRLISHLSNSFQ